METLEILESMLRLLKIEMYYCSDKGRADNENLIEIAKITSQMSNVAHGALERQDKK